MLSDRDYMREPEYRPRKFWSASTILMMVLTACFALQLANNLVFKKPDYYYYFAINPDWLKHLYLWQPVTYMFLHGGVLHLLFNLLGIYFFGRIVEQYLGWKKFFIIYFLSGILGGILQGSLGVVLPEWFGGEPMPENPIAQAAYTVVGASAGVCGLLAVFCLLEPHARILLFFVIPVKAIHVFWGSLAVSLFFMSVPTDRGVAHAAHFGGLLTGWALIKAGLHLEFGGLWNRLPNPLGWFRRPQRKIMPVNFKTGAPGASANGPTPPPVDVDRILDKISANGIQSLTAEERRALEAARQKMKP